MKIRDINQLHLGISAVVILLLTTPLFCSILPQMGKPNIILITVDTTRSDHLGIYGYKKPISPNIDRIVRDCVIFDQAVTPVPLTLPSHASILTGSYPAYHNVHDNSVYQLSQDAVTIGEVLQKNGYTTAAFVAAYVLHRRFGLNQGFNYYNDDFSEGRRSELIYAERDAKSMTDAVLKWMNSGVKQPLFLWVHYYDPHDPYTPPQVYSKKMGNDYDGEINYMDEQVGRLLDFLKNKKMLNNSMIIMVGDHGEGLNEHKELYHGIFLYDTTVRVPLIVCSSKFGKTQKRLNAQVSVMDIFSTVLDYVGIQGYKKSQGKSLIPMINNQESQELPIYLETMLPYFTYGLSPMEGVRTSAYKFIKSPKSELYDMEKDRKENTNLYISNAVIAKKMLNKMHFVKSKIPPPLKMRMMSMDPESIAVLQSLGYISTPAPSPSPKAKLEDPKDHYEVFTQFTEAQDAMAEGKYENAIKILQQVKKALPACHLAGTMLGLANMQLGNYQEAIKYYNEEKSALKEIAYFSIGNVYFKMRDFDNAKKQYEEALKLNPELVEAYIASGEISVLTGKVEEAEALLAKADKLKVNDSKLRYLQGLIQAVKQNYPAAEEYFKEAIELNPSYGMAYACLGKLYAEKGDMPAAIRYYDIAIQLMPGNRDVLLQLASIYMKPGSTNVTEAFRLFKKALELDPNAPDAANIRAMIKNLQGMMVPK
ncbi:MAG: hypothetical protein A2Y62_21575 [Candidatus Fischerbacteria bacterium RBG_13_37_8]|uniref:Sulfatase N-terminal domain-containing protein n=1 Tax=Candidatus Fischerbacteria bacterium RBG_13_37_8 TaxID=1817863 RepID=A0A1F5VKW4_9BACT|nr:MAG: hypothetical protein A2Y62_21575 [Candidatus Fischerbacteria bacterium RBG_13_37_8]